MSDLERISIFPKMSKSSFKVERAGEWLASPTHAAALCQRLKVLPEEIFLTAVSSASHCPQSLVHTRHFCLLLLFLVRAVLAWGLHICRI